MNNEGFVDSFLARNLSFFICHWSFVIVSGRVYRMRTKFTMGRFGWVMFIGLSAALLPCGKARAGAKPATYRNTAPGVAYAGSRACAVCHRDIYDRYVKTDMGRSMSRPAHPSHLEKGPETIFNQKLNRYFQVFREGSEIYQSEYELDSSGNEVFRNAQKIEYVVGAGANGFSHIVRRGDYLFQAPLSFYSKTGKWELSPGYELNDYGFSRPILPGCIVCHSGQPQPVRERHGLYRDPPFKEPAIGCENCHGPGQLHVQERAKGLSRGTDRSIVNPARLPGWLADNICMNCHQGGEARVLQPGKDHLDFRPGTPLDDTVAIFKVAPSRYLPQDSDVLEHYWSMTLSACYRASGGRLRCTSCHDPHVQPAADEAPAYFRKKCLGCHSEQSCALPVTQRSSARTGDACASCHLPKRDIKTIAHSSLSNHRIVRREGQTYPEAAFRETPGLPGLIHVNAVPGRSAARIPRLTLLQVYGELMDARPAYRERYLELLDELSRSAPAHWLILSALARRELIRGTEAGGARAIEYLSRAVDAGSTSPADFKELADLLARAEKLPEAIKVLERGIALAPYTPVLYKALALHYIKLGKHSEALATMKRELELFPEDPFMRNLVR